MSKAWIGIGANLDKPCVMVDRAIGELSLCPDIRLDECSSKYSTAPIGFSGQADFCNAVARIDTALKPGELLDTLHAIEDGLGRVRRGPRFGPRVIDLDLLLFENHQSGQGERPVLPHPRMHQRRFVLEPLVELDPDAMIPGYGLATVLLAACVGQRVVRIQ